MIFLNQIVARLLVTGIGGNGRNSAGAGRRIAGFTNDDVSSQLLVGGLQFLQASSMRIVHLIEIRHLQVRKNELIVIKNSSINYLILNDRDGHVTSLLNLSWSERTVMSYWLSLFRTSCSNLNLSFVSLVFSTRTWLCDSVSWSRSFESADTLDLVIWFSSSSNFILERSYKHTDIC